MRLAPKLSIALSGLFVLVLCGAFTMAYRSEKKRLERDQDRRIAACLARAARLCAEGTGRDADRACLSAIRASAELTYPRAFREGFYVDTRRRMRAHTHFLTGDYSLRDTRIRDDWVRRGVSRGEPGSERRKASDGGVIEVRTTPVMRGGTRLGTVFFLYREDKLAESLTLSYRRSRRRLFQGALAGAGIGILVAVCLVMYFLGPIQPILAGARRVSGGDLATRIPEGRPDELGDLASEFNAMTGRLAELDALKEDFVKRITHDLKNPLNAILSNAEVVHEGYHGPLNEKQAEAVRGILESGKALAELMDEILDVTRLDSGRMALEPAALDLPAAVEAALGLMRERAGQLGVSMEPLLPPDIKTVHADPKALQSVLTHLLSNALKFTPEKGAVTVAAHRGGANEIVIVVSDTGVGIPANRLGSVFEKFFKVPETSNKVRTSGGSGLGLYVCRKIVEAHGGRIWAESEMFRGSRFYFSLSEKKPDKTA